jgi:hypothetical protein
MGQYKNGVTRALFRAITGDGEQVAVGASNNASVNFGVRKYRSLTNARVEALKTRSRIVYECSAE